MRSPRARAAFPRWRAVAPGDRARLLRRLAVAVEEHGEELALLETRNVGKPIADSRGEVGMVAEVFHFYAGAIDKHHGQTIPVAGGIDMTFHEAARRGGADRPLELPVEHRQLEVGTIARLRQHRGAQARRADTPVSAAAGGARAGGGDPGGVVNVVVGPGRVVGERLVEHPDVAKISFTGSTEVGAQVMRGAAGTVKRVSLELGGKSANVVFADADLETAASAGAGCGVRQRRPGLLRAVAHPGAALRRTTSSWPSSSRRRGACGWVTRRMNAPRWVR